MALAELTVQDLRCIETAELTFGPGTTLVYGANGAGKTSILQIIDPDAHKLIEDSSIRRRRWLDWAVFHVEPGFASAWSRYQRALLQRNAALKTGSAPVSIWDEELAREGETLTAARERVLTALLPYWTAIPWPLTRVATVIVERQPSDPIEPISASG